MPERRDRDPGRQVEEPVAVEVFDHCAFGSTHDQGVDSRVRRRHHSRVASNPLAGSGTGQRAEDMRIVAMESDHRRLPLPGRRGLVSDRVRDDDGPSRWKRWLDKRVNMIIRTGIDKVKLIGVAR